MIRSLHIKNYALIEELELFPSERLNIITGETGAGKSILLGAIGLLLGNRADLKLLYDQAKKCVVEGVFSVDEEKIKLFFKELDIDYEQECVIRREISPSGKSRAFVNDSPTTLDVLKKLSPVLMDIHSQHENLDLGNNRYQLEVLDNYCGHFNLLKQQKSDFSKFKYIKEELNQVEELSNTQNQDLEYKKFVLDELLKANLVEDESDNLEKELAMLENAAEIKEALTYCQKHLDEEDPSILGKLQEVKMLLGKLSPYHPDYEGLKKRIESTSIELKDINDEIISKNDRTTLDPERLHQARERIDLIFRLRKKHAAGDDKDLLRIQKRLEKETQETEGLDEIISALKRDLKEAKEILDKSSLNLSESRTSKAGQLSRDIEKVIKNLGIENGQVKVQLAKREVTLEGIDHVEFLFSANKGQEKRPLRQVASGGEFSRLIFALKYLMADKTSLPTMIFDEIDTGVSGEVAMRMVKLMKKMAEKHQVISISHLPQFAAAADEHYFVFKEHSSRKSVSKIKKLAKEERTINIAEMIGGHHPSEMARKNAHELMAQFGN